MRNIEDLFKESLKDHELPYNKEAWSKMNKKLDARNSGSSNGFKWILGAAGAALIVATYLFMGTCLLYTSPSPRDATLSRMPSSA